MQTEFATTLPIQPPQALDRNSVIASIRAALKRRSGKDWSVTGGRGTAWGWIKISSPPRRLVDGYYMSREDCAELARLLGLSQAHVQGVDVAASSAHYREYIDRAEGRTPAEVAKPYWD
jgi:hypothetical protein